MTTTTKVDWANVLKEADAAGRAAAEATKPTPMVVYEADGLSNDPKPGGKSWYVPQGPCGFAWVSVPGNSPLGRWVRKNAWGRGGWSKGYPTGYHLWVSLYNQSVELKSAYAYAYAKVLRAYEVDASSASRLD